jgi:SMODS domain-containing protein
MVVATTRLTQLDDLLARISEKLQLSPTDYGRVEQSYRAVTDWLRAKDSPVAKFLPDIYAQGSFNIRTTVKPRGRDEFDLDFVCELRIDPSAFPNPIVLLDMIEARLRASGVYKDKITRKNRCIRISFDRFHMDTLPACTSPSVGHYGEHSVVVPDCDAHDWKASNPKGYAYWFDDMAREAVVRFVKNVEPLPEQQSHEELATLNLNVQLMKRHRDVQFEKKPTRAPISIVLTTLAAQNYRGQTSVAEAMTSILDGMVAMIPNVASRRLVVLNPTNAEEDLSERWDSDPDAYLDFVSWATNLQNQWNELMAATGMQNISAILEKMFGERVAKDVIAEHIKSYERPRYAGELAVERGTGLIVPATVAGSVPIRRNTFYGED